jgi:hypothetical protein
MPKYRKKPVVIEAVQFDGSSISADMISSWSDKKVWSNTTGFGEFLGSLSINTLEGVMTASKGDYIIKGIKGEYYPCKPDIFEATYEKVDENTQQ